MPSGPNRRSASTSCQRLPGDPGHQHPEHIGAGVVQPFLARAGRPAAGLPSRFIHSSGGDRGGQRAGGQARLGHGPLDGVLPRSASERAEAHHERQQIAHRDRPVGRDRVVQRPVRAGSAPGGRPVRAASRLPGRPAAAGHSSIRVIAVAAAICLVTDAMRKIASRRIGVPPPSASVRPSVIDVHLAPPGHRGDQARAPPRCPRAGSAPRASAPAVPPTRPDPVIGRSFSWWPNVPAQG